MGRVTQNFANTNTRSFSSDHSCWSGLQFSNIMGYWNKGMFHFSMVSLWNTPILFGET
jgi:hypothetical protein